MCVLNFSSPVKHVNNELWSHDMKTIGKYQFTIKYFLNKGHGLLEISYDITRS